MAGMAGKKKKVDDAPQSKTARASMKKGQKKEEGFKASGDMNRIIPLAQGEFAYVLDPRSGKTYHLRRGSMSWDLIMTDLLGHAEHGPRIQAELDKLGWV